MSDFRFDSATLKDEITQNISAIKSLRQHIKYLSRQDSLSIPWAHYKPLMRWRIDCRREYATACFTAHNHGGSARENILLLWELEAAHWYAVAEWNRFIELQTSNWDSYGNVIQRVIPDRYEEEYPLPVEPALAPAPQPRLARVKREFRLPVISE